MRPSEWRWHGTRVDGARFDLQGVVIYRIEGVRIVRGRLYMGDLPDYAYTKEEEMTTLDIDTAPSGPPPVATRHDHQGLIVTKIERPAPEVLATCRSLYTGIVLDHLGKHGSMTPDMKPVWSGAFLCGPAITCLGADWRIRSMAADLAEPGDVIVLAAGGLQERACFGDMTATCWKSKGIEGVVIDGAARDVARLRTLAFPVFARGVTPRNFHYPAGLDHGAVNVPVVCAGVLVAPGDIVIGDDDGVVVVPKRIAAEIVEAASQYLEGENAGRALFGEQYVSFGVKGELEERGYRFV